MSKADPNRKLITKAEKQVIRDYASVPPEAATAPKQVLRAKAIEVYYAYLDRFNKLKRERKTGPALELKAIWPDEIAFMSEDSNPVPDYTLKRMYRERLAHNE